MPEEMINSLPAAAPDRQRGERFAALITKKRRLRNMSQDELCDQSGVSRSTVSRWERGLAERPDPDQVRAVCAALEIDPIDATVALGFLTSREVLQLRSDGLPARALEVVALLEDPDLTDAERNGWVDYLRYMRNNVASRRSAAGS